MKSAVPAAVSALVSAAVRVLVCVQVRQNLPDLAVWGFPFGIVQGNSIWVGGWSSDRMGSQLSSGGSWPVLSLAAVRRTDFPVRAERLGNDFLTSENIRGESRMSGIAGAGVMISAKDSCPVAVLNWWLWRAMLIGVLLWPFSSIGADETATRDRRYRQLHERRAAVLEGLSERLGELAAWCESRQLGDAAEATAALRDQLSHPELLPEPSSQVQSELPESVTDEQSWEVQLRAARKQSAGELYTLARSALRAGFPSLAFSLTGDVVRLDPDHRFARGVLGYQLFMDPERRGEAGYSGEWISLFEKQMRSGRSPQVRHPQFGWIPSANVNRYEQGLRPWKGDWISAEREAEFRRDFRNAWEVPSEHFLVKTNVSLEAGLELSEKLETFHGWLQQNFAAFFDTPKSLQERFEKALRTSSARRGKPLEVHYYASREEYQKRVQGKVPPGLETNGLYWQPDRTCYFYLKPQGPDFTTLFHEATHQILDVHTTEARRVASRMLALQRRQQPQEWVLCERANFWLIEGIACYFESFMVDEGGNISVGDPGCVRFDTARQRMLDPAYYFYLPAREFFALGRDGFQRHPQISPLYTQSSGFVHFLMHYEDGLYRDDLIELLAEIYRPDAEHPEADPNFSQIAEVGWTELDRQYREHMRNLDDELQQREVRGAQQ